MGFILKKLLVIIASATLLFSGMYFAPGKAFAQGKWIDGVGKCTLTIYKKNLGPDNRAYATGDCSKDVHGFYWGPQSNNYMIGGPYTGIVKDGQKIKVFFPNGKYAEYEVTVYLPDEQFKSFKGKLTSNVDVRATSKSNSKVIGKLKKNEIVTVVGGSYKSVYKIKYGKGYGYVPAKYVKQ